MALLTPPQPGRLRHASHLELRIGGAESNVAIALARLDIEAGWLSRVGDDELGKLVVGRVRAEGVDVSQVAYDSAPTGLYFREQAPLGARAHYYRRGSAASTLAPGAFNAEILNNVRFVHLTGVTAALSESCADYLLWVADEARRRHVRVSFDINYRSRLWSGAAARTYFERLLPHVDVLFVSDEEARIVWRDVAETRLLEMLASYGPQEILLKHGARGCSARVDGEDLHTDGFPVKAVETTGAGDAFAAGYLAASLWDQPAAERLRTANALGAFNVLGYGDYESLPSRGELDAFLNNRTDMGR